MSGSWAADTLHDLGLEDVALDEVTPASIEGLPEPLIHQIASLCYVGDICSLSRQPPLVPASHDRWLTDTQAPVPHPKALARRINQSIDTYYPRAYYYKDFHRKARIMEEPVEDIIATFSTFAAFGSCAEKILESWERRQIFALLTHSLMMHMMANTITDRPASEYLPLSTASQWPRRRTTLRSTLPLPRGKLPSEGPRRINTFSSFEVWDTWYRAQVREVAAEIDRGEWVGCILVTAGGYNSGSILPIQEVRFELGPKCESVSGDAIKIRAWNFTSCATPTSHNSLEGTFRRELDCLSMELMNSEVELVGWITPMGIAGVLEYEPLRPEEGGYFWLWKREWGGGFIDVGSMEVPFDVLNSRP
ncbi:hypothetical protein CPLU01_09544 [Colletotrichum plurivorum]|uniref:Uncharacterized protein n=1 Tax=Colletotrichum plurivorum TaxID=2175906 RepID=A0A8H6K7W8_9PEZI|nr:hypothetical protein CPLU01_09544 [Colletotrichum plurivorum]